MTDRNPKLLLPSVQESVEMEHVSTSPKVTVTTRLVGRILLSGYGSFHLVLSERQHFSTKPQVHPRFLQIQPSPAEMEHVSTSPDNAKSGPLENGSYSQDIVSQGAIFNKSGILQSSACAS